MPRKKADWTVVRMSYPCLVCNAPPGEPCLTATGNRKNELHAERGREAQRCPKCGDRIAADAEPVTLCDRCRLVRRLEIERASYHVRRY
jgi:hypothetical protein